MSVTGRVAIVVAHASNSLLVDIQLTLKTDSRIRNEIRLIAALLIVKNAVDLESLLRILSRYHDQESAEDSQMCNFHDGVMLLISEGKDMLVYLYGRQPSNLSGLSQGQITRRAVTPRKTAEEGLCAPINSPR